MTAEIYNNADFSGWREENRDWARDFAVALIGQDGATNAAVHEVLERTRRFSNDSNLTAQQLMGEPSKAARAAFTDVDLSEGKAENRVETTFGAFCTGVLIALIETFIFSLVMLDGWTTNIEAILFVGAFATVMMCAGVVAYNFFKRGMVGTCIAVAVAGVAGIVATVMGMGPWVENTDIVFSAPGLLMIELALIVLFGWLCFSDRFIYRAPVDSRDWFTQFEGVLRGQHLLSKSEARSYVEEARTHLAESGAGDPFEEFGKPATYAQQLVGDSPRAIRRGATAQITVRWLQFLGFIWLAYIFAASKGWSLWGLAFAILFTLLAAWNLWSHTRKEKYRRDERLSEVGRDDL